MSTARSRGERRTLPLLSLGARCATVGSRRTRRTCDRCGRTRTAIVQSLGGRSPERIRWQASISASRGSERWNR